MSTAEERYDALCELASEHGAQEALRILDLFDPDPDLVSEAADRWHLEHVTNSAGRVEGMVVADDAEFVATAQCGPQDGQTRRFDSYAHAWHWLLNQDARDVPTTS